MSAGACSFLKSPLRMSYTSATVPGQREMGVPALSVTKYSASLGGPSCTAERNGDWLEEGADANCTVQKEIEAGSQWVHLVHGT